MTYPAWHLKDVMKTRAFFLAHGEDPQIYAPDFFWYHVALGKTPAEIFRIACGQHES